MADAVAEKKKKKKNPFASMGRFFREVKAEMKKVVWPSRKQVVNNTLIVFAVVLVAGIFIWVLDLIFQYGIFQFLK